MQHGDSHPAVNGTTALKFDMRVSSAHIIQFPGAGNDSRQIKGTASSSCIRNQQHGRAYTNDRHDTHTLRRPESRATPAQTIGVIGLFTLLTIVAGIL